ncbi:LIM-domain-containing protein [Wallemia mellicola]|nr:hypothetical protein E3Q24_00548 [Wallemia mellicola]TIC01509.1 LIM-domain-containing protein [Wallemia mellicola]TIC15356.1 LIM-domain-containing protein [Wallemia mellicola]
MRQLPMTPNARPPLPTPPTSTPIDASKKLPSPPKADPYILPKSSTLPSIPGSSRPPLPTIPNVGSPPPPIPLKSPKLPSTPLSSTSSKPISKLTSTYPEKSLVLGLSTCNGCQKVVVEGRVVNAMNAHWHPECFNCAYCGEALEHVEYFEHEGKPYCHLDYHEHFSPYCFHCQTPILETNFITIDDDAFTESNGPSRRLYHLNHFFCVQCGDPFLDPSNEFKTLDKPYTMYKGHPYCESCHNSLHKPKCKSCGKSVIEDAVDALGGLFHLQCFVCEGCQLPFNDHAFFEQVGKPWCETCFDILIRNLV